MNIKNHFKFRSQITGAILASVIGIGNVQAAEYQTFGISAKDGETTILFRDSGPMILGSVPHGSATVSTNIIKETVPSVYASVFTPASVFVERGYADFTYGARIYGPPDTTIGLGFKGVYSLTSSIGESDYYRSSTAFVRVNVSSSSSPNVSADPATTSFSAYLLNEARLNGLDEHQEWIRVVDPTKYSFTEVSEKNRFIEHNIMWLETKNYRGDGDSDQYFDRLAGQFNGSLNIPLNWEGAAYLTINLRADVRGKGIGDTATAFLDPYLFLDPDSQRIYPGARLEIESGVGNTPALAIPTHAVPEPATYGLLFAGILVILGTSKHRKKTYC